MFTTDRIFRLLFLLGVAFVAYSAGIFALHQHMEHTKYLTDAFDAGAALYEKKEHKEPHGPRLPEISSEELMSHIKTTWDHKYARSDYNIVTIHLSTTAYLVDMSGKIVYKWSLPYADAWPTPFINNTVDSRYTGFSEAAVFPNGDLLVSYVGEGDTPWGYGMLKMDKDSHVIWRYDDNTHHEFYIDKEFGNIYTLVHHWRVNPIMGMKDLWYPLLEDFVAILSPDGHELRKFSILESFRGTPYESQLKPWDIKNWDITHGNSVTKLEPEMAAAFPTLRPEDIVVSLRNISLIAVIDPITLKVVKTFTGPWKGQHSAKLDPDGTIVFMNNIAGWKDNSINFSSVFKLDPITSEVIWSHGSDDKDLIYNYYYGRVQVLPNANILVTSPNDHRAFEVTPTHKIVWNFQGNDMIESVKRYTAAELPFLKKIKPAAPNNSPSAAGKNDRASAR